MLYARKIKYTKTIDIHILKLYTKLYYINKTMQLFNVEMR